MYKVLLSFMGADGKYPEASLTDVNGTLYGTTDYGGQESLGTVFAITPSGTQTVVHSFKGSPKDGALPEAGLVNVNGTLYGTTTFGGGKGCGGEDGCGTVFAITPSGKEMVLHSFGRSGDGAYPQAALLTAGV
jgi:uncharacterized repeat protein (TIGR03803 family)